MIKPKSVVLVSAVALLAVAGFPRIADSQWTPRPAAMAYGLVGSDQHWGGRPEPRGRAFSGRGFGGGTSGGGALGGGAGGFSDDSSTPRHSDPIPGPSLQDRSDLADTQSGPANSAQTGTNGRDGSSRGSRADDIAGGRDGVGSEGAGRGDQRGR